MTYDPNSQLSDQASMFSIRTNKNLIDRIKKHIKLLKRLEEKFSQQKWIEEAISEKFEKIEKMNLTEDFSDKFLSFKLNKTVNKKIENLLKDFRKIGIRLNKKEFFLEAIIEKLEREEEKVNQKAQELLQQMIISNLKANL